MMFKLLRGYTYFEFLISISLVVLAFSYAIPSYLSLRHQNMEKLLIEDIKSAVYLARNTAIIKQTNVILSPLVGNNWSSGLKLMLETNKNKINPDENFIMQWAWDFPNLNVRWKGFRSERFIIFSRSLKNAATSGHFEILDKNGSIIWIIINRYGRLHEQTKRWRYN